MKVGFAELGKKFILSKYPRKFFGADRKSKDILERFGADRKSKRYPQKIWVWTKDPKVIIKRYWGGQKIQNLS